jgi:hypothetical protein
LQTFGWDYAIWGGVYLIISARASLQSPSYLEFRSNSQQYLLNGHTSQGEGFAVGGWHGGRRRCSRRPPLPHFTRAPVRLPRTGPASCCYQFPISEDTDTDLGNPWLAWGLYLAWQRGEARGWRRGLRFSVRRALIIVLSRHQPGDTVRYSEIVPLQQALALRAGRTAGGTPGDGPARR